MDEFRVMTVRELIMALAEVEDDIRRTRLGPPLPAGAVRDSGSEGTAADGDVGVRLIELGVREQRIVEELRARRGA